MSLASIQGRMASTASVLGNPAPASATSSLAQLHVTSAGDHLVSDVAFDFPNNTIRIPLHGSILGVPYDLELDITINLKAGTVTVELKVNKPFQLDYKWVFKINGLIALPGGTAALATGVELASGDLVSTGVAGPEISTPFAFPQIDILCIITCGGAQLLPIIVQCLPSLLAGVPAFLACLAAQAPAGLANIAQCIATKCIKH